MSPNPPVATDLVLFIGAPLAVHSTGPRARSMTRKRVSVLTGGAAPPPPNGAPYAASGLTATGGNGQVTLSWTAGSGATSYNLYRAAEAASESSNAARSSPASPAHPIPIPVSTAAPPITTRWSPSTAPGSSGFSPEAHATTSGVNPTRRNSTLKPTSQGWAAGGGIISGVATSTAQHFAGNQSLAVNFNGSSAGTVVRVCGQRGCNSGHDDYLPCLDSERQQGHHAPALSSGPQLGMDQRLVCESDCQRLEHDHPDGAANAVSPLQNLGIQFITSAGWTGTCYIDSVSLTTPSPDFNLSANPTSLTVNGGTNGTSTITVTPIYGLNGCYTLSASNLPSGVTATFATNPITGGASTLTFTASNTVASGTSNVTITATCGLLSHTTTIALTLNGVTPPTRRRPWPPSPTRP